MTIADDELARLEALAAQGGLTGEDISEAFRLLPALVAEVRRLRGELRYEAITDRATLGAERDAARLTSEELTRANLAMARERDALRAENERLRSQLCADDEDEPLRAEIVKLRGVAEDLRDKFGAVSSRADEWERTAHDAVAENERLRASLADAEHTINGGPHEGGLVHKVARLEAENERLREESTHYDAQLEGAMSLAETAMLNPDWTAINPNIREQVRGDMDALRAEAAELRASLADAVVRMERMEKVVEAVLNLRRSANGVERARNAIYLRDATDAYEASLPGIEKVGP